MHKETKLCQIRPCDYDTELNDLLNVSKLRYFFENYVNRYRRKRSKVNATIFESALSHTRRSDASEKRVEKSVSTFERFRLWTSFESLPVSVNLAMISDANYLTFSD